MQAKNTRRQNSGEVKMHQPRDQSDWNTAPTRSPHPKCSSRRSSHRKPFVAAYHALGRAGSAAKRPSKSIPANRKKSNNLNPSLVGDSGGVRRHARERYRDTTAIVKPRKPCHVQKHDTPILRQSRSWTWAKSRSSWPLIAIIAYDIVGKHIDDYDSIFVLSHFKGHPMGGFAAR